MKLASALRSPLCPRDPSDPCSRAALQDEKFTIEQLRTHFELAMGMSIERIAISEVSPNYDGRGAYVRFASRIDAARALWLHHSSAMQGEGDPPAATAPLAAEASAPDPSLPPLPCTGERTVQLRPSNTAAIGYRSRYQYWEANPGSDPEPAPSSGGGGQHQSYQQGGGANRFRGRKGNPPPPPRNRRPAPQQADAPEPAPTTSGSSEGAAAAAAAASPAASAAPDAAAIKAVQQQLASLVPGTGNAAAAAMLLPQAWSSVMPNLMSGLDMSALAAHAQAQMALQMQAQSQAALLTAMSQLLSGAGAGAAAPGAGAIPTTPLPKVEDITEVPAEEAEGDKEDCDE